LQKEDLWRYDESREAKAMADRLNENLQKRRAQGVTKNLLLKAINDTFFWQFWSAGLLKVCSSIGVGD
jgi:hypothetical protein